MENNIVGENSPGPTKEEIVKKREGNVLDLLKKPLVWVILSLILLLILGFYIRIQPMLTRPDTGRPGLWDIYTNDWTLGPDLDPWLFTRYAKTIAFQGGLPEIDYMRNVPLGFKTSGDTTLLPRMISWTYLLTSNFGYSSFNFAAALFPVIMFLLTIISFFLLVREIFYKKSAEDNNLKANIISLISTLFLVIIPAFIQRTVAGIPEKESAAFFFLFLAFYFFLKSWKSEKTSRYIILSILAGLSTLTVGAIWGGILYIYLAVALSVMIAFILNKVNKKEYFVYTIWLFSSLIPLVLFTGRLKLNDVLVSLDTGFACLIFAILTVHFIICKTPIQNIKFLNTTKIPKNIISLVIALLLGIIGSTILFGPNFILNKIDVINHALLTPTTGRWQVTVAENRQPFFNEWGSSFGPFFRTIPLLFWLFFIGSIVLFKQMLKSIKERDSSALTIFYVLFFFGLVFSRYSSASILNGENFISKAFYFGSALLIGLALMHYIIKYHKNGDASFEKVEYGLILLFSLFVLCLVTTRGAVRLIMVLAPIAPIFAAYLIVHITYKFFKTEDGTGKVIYGCCMAIVVITSIFTCWSFYKEAVYTANVMIPSYYNQQWQNAMGWVRNETPKNAVFASWWDYGYWLQSVGERATVTDGGNAIAFWNYYMGRLVLTGDNQQDALNFLWNHNATNFLIDSSDIEKYGAYSSIGSNENYDRLSYIPVYFMDEKQTQETKNETIYVYSTGGLIPLDEDLTINYSDKKVFLPAGKAGVIAMSLPVKSSNASLDFEQPSVIIFYQNAQYNVELRYLYTDGKMKDFGTGINATMFVYPRLFQSSTGSIGINQMGAAMYLSPLLTRSFMVNVYLLNDALGRYPNFVLIHTEPPLLISELRKQGLPLPDIVYLQGVQAPIKIWDIKYTGKETPNPAYLDRVASKYLNWSL
jgi:asparagine N-glycosylation enzyme membrane subunit Stt3